MFRVVTHQISNNLFLEREIHYTRAFVKDKPHISKYEGFWTVDIELNFSKHSLMSAIDFKRACDIAEEAYDSFSK